MTFRTELPVKKATTSIDLPDSIITIGSCFADDIGARFLENKFQILKNPFGTIYNPISIHGILNSVIKDTGPTSSGFLVRDGLHYHHDFHSDWFGHSQEELTQRLVSRMATVRSSLLTCRHLIVTYGTSWVYESKALRSIVANCHKLPQAGFEKFLLTQKKIVESFEGFYRALHEMNPNCQIILTVSPVRHTKDTLELNSVSKSILRLTCHTLCETLDRVMYFPAYEIMMDDLRDYRFYERDMIHPSSQAVDYIWEKFGTSFFTEGTLAFIQQWEKIRIALLHRPVHATGQGHQKFVSDLLDRLYQLSGKVDVSEEIAGLKKQLIGTPQQ